MTEQTAKFHIGDVLSVTTGAMLSPSEKRDGPQSVVAHIIPKADIRMSSVVPYSEAAKEFLEEQMPWLAAVKFPGVPRGSSLEDARQIVRDFLAPLAAEHGEYIEVGQMKERPKVDVKAYIDEKFAAGAGRDSK